MVNGVKSAGSTGLIYYGDLIVTGLTPSTGPFGSATSGSVNGGPFSDSPTFPGMSNVYVYTFIADYASGCTSTGQCAFTMPNIAGDLSAPQGAYSVAIGTPGGSATAYFLVGTTPATPTITSVSPLTGPAAGGNMVTVTGTGFRQVPGAQTMFIVSVPGAGVSSQVGPMTCANNTTCSFVAPAGGPGGLADFQVITTCNSGSACAGTRASGSIPSTKTGAYTYSGLKITPGGGTMLFTSESGQTAQYTVALRTQPTANVHVAVSTMGGGGSLSTSGLDFTTSNWNTPQTVTITGLDNGADGERLLQRREHRDEHRSQLQQRPVQPAVHERGQRDEEHLHLAADRPGDDPRRRDGDLHRGTDPGAVGERRGQPREQRSGGWNGVAGLADVLDVERGRQRMERAADGDRHGTKRRRGRPKQGLLDHRHPHLCGR